METTKYIENLSPEWGHLFIESAIAHYSEAVLSNPHQFKWNALPLDEFERIAANVKMKKEEEYELLGFPKTIKLGPTSIPEDEGSGERIIKDDSFTPDWDEIDKQSGN